ncbi:MAG TPA: NAD-dependent epimerase/dehydratase family protein, partial [Puia sp.]|nr:NAD-dependent epimerase/dehydratase family protein [Puia sp.]
MKILIAGGAGYLGSALVPKLQERGYLVDVLDLMWFGNHLPTGTKIIQKDIFDIHESDLKDYEQVIFLAGLSNDPMAEYSPAKNFIYNASA